MTTSLTIGPTPRELPEPPPPHRTRNRWHLIANAVTLGWLALAVAALLGGDRLRASGWLPLHLLLLGAATNAIVTWGEHFSVALLHAPPPKPRPTALRLVILNAAVISILAGVTADVSALTVAGSGLLLAVAAVYAASLLRLLSRPLSGRFAVVVAHYVVATGALAIGIGFGVALANLPLAPRTHNRFYAAHVHATLLGWVAFTVLGTLVMLWPTVLRTQMIDGVVAAARRGLRVAAAGLTVAVAGLAFGEHLVAAAGVLGVLAGVWCHLRVIIGTGRRSRPTGAAPWLLTGSLLWLTAALVADVVSVLLLDDGAFVVALQRVTPAFVVGFVAQALVGSMTFLLPVLLHGHPTVVAASARRMATAWRARLVALNVGAALTVAGDRWATSGWWLVAAALTVSLTLAVATMVERLWPQTPPAGTTPSSSRRRRGVFVGIAVAVAIVAVPILLRVTQPATSATGPLRRISLTLGDGHVAPARVEVAASTHVVLIVTNTDAERHDLRFAGVASTRLLSQGTSQTIDLGTVTKDLAGRCTVPGHAATGMTFALVVAGPTSAGGRATGGSGSGDQAEPGAAAAPLLDSHAVPAPDWRPYDAALHPAAAAQEHRVTWHVRETVAEVAPGVRQMRWTFDGTAPGPTLRGHVGDLFTVTLVNDGSMGHGLDFHASETAPDIAMRTIQPGHSLVYQFRADHAGVWLYHCSASPTLDHIANGMYGAVIIDPPGLAPVAHDFVVVQSELYLGPSGSTANDATLRSGARDASVFNGYAWQYVQAPLTARVGERIRIWVLAAGPETGTSFHVVGAHFDTVFKEGAYLLRPGGAGAAQALDLSVSQGGFVEFTVHAPGHYPFVDHDMRAAESGAKGVLAVSP